MSKTVCVVDDDELLRAYVAQLLEPEGFTVTQAADGNSGFKQIEADAPFAAIIDIIMPDCDGIELIGRLRQRWPDMRIIAMSAGGRVGPGLFLETAKKIGANACLTKPIHPDELVEALR